MFEGIREEVARLQSDYETGNFDRVAASHAALMKTALALAVRSSLMARGPGPVTAEWSEIGTEVLRLL